MKEAKQFIKDCGWSLAIIEANNDTVFFGGDISFSLRQDLKPLIDAYELVQTGLQELKDKMFSNEKTIDDVKQWVLTVNESLLTPKGIELKQAIKLVESVDE